MGLNWHLCRDPALWTLRTWEARSSLRSWKTGSLCPSSRRIVSSAAPEAAPESSETGLVFPL